VLVDLGRAALYERLLICAGLPVSR
jgi:hypothetical protein